MSDIPHELIAAIGDFLLPKWRCRLFICCKEWYEKCYICNANLFIWLANNRNNIKNIDKIVYNENRYMETIANEGMAHVSIRIVPHWKGRRILWKIHSKWISTLCLRSYSCSFNDTDGSIWYEDDPYETHYRYKYLMMEYYQYNLHSDNEYVKILFNNFENIIKYLNIYEVFKFWISLGIRYYYLMPYKHHRLCLYIKKYRKSYRKIKKKSIMHGVRIKW
jgi:hypothetical protein